MKLPKGISNLKSQISKSSKGFTLVELIVVIGVLGILASGLLATIDPLEQFRKGQDSNRKSTSIELINAITRYYSTHLAMPWAAPTAGGSGCNSTNAPTGAKANAAAFTNCLASLVAEGELKASFTTASILGDLYVTELGTGESVSVAVCFDPASKSESARTETVNTFTGTSVSAGSYYCAK